MYNNKSYSVGLSNGNSSTEYDLLGVGSDQEVNFFALVYHETFDLDISNEI